MSFHDRFLTALNGRPLTESQRQIIEQRYVPAVEKAMSDHWWVGVKYNGLMLAVSISTVLVTSLISLEKIVGLSQDARNAIFWVALAAAFVATVANKLLYFTGLNRQYVLESVSVSKLTSEGWMFVARAGKYNSAHATPDDLFKEFAKSCEKIISAVEKGVAINAGKSSGNGPGIGGSSGVGLTHNVSDMAGGYSDDLIIELGESSFIDDTTDSLYETPSDSASTNSKGKSKAGSKKVKHTHSRGRKDKHTNENLRELFHTTIRSEDINTVHSLATNPGHHNVANTLGLSSNTNSGQGSNTNIVLDQDADIVQTEEAEVITSKSTTGSVRSIHIARK